MKTTLALIAGIVIVLSTSCTDDLFIRGNGIPETEVRLVPAFSVVSSEGNFEVQIEEGEEIEVSVHAESNLLPFILTDVRDNTLKIHVKGIHSLQNKLPVEIYVTVPSLKTIVQSGSGNITAGLISGEHVNCVISGSGTIEALVDAAVIDAAISGSGKLSVSGMARDANMVISGSGEMDAWNLKVKNCDARISGSGDIWINVEQYLKAVISGSGNVFYQGSPIMETSISGSGGVIHKN